jgi:hypothetical protein
VLALIQGVQLYRAWFISGPILQKLNTQGEGVQELVDFVQSIDASTCSGTDCAPSDTERLLTNFITILCSSSDDMQREACVQLGYVPTDPTVFEGET